MRINSVEDILAVITIIGAIGSFVTGAFILFGKLTKLIDSINNLNISVKVMRDDFIDQKLSYAQKFTRDDERLNSHERRLKKLEHET